MKRRRDETRMKIKATTRGGRIFQFLRLTPFRQSKTVLRMELSGQRETQYVTALEIPPVVSPQTAVRASIVADSKKH